MILKLIHESGPRPGTACSDPTYTYYCHAYRADGGKQELTRNLSALAELSWDYNGLTIFAPITFRGRLKTDAVQRAILALDPAVVLALRSGLVEEITLEVEP